MDKFYKQLLTKLIIQYRLFLLFISHVIEHSGDWYNIPNDISAYLNCSLSVSGTFNSTNDSYLCKYHYTYIINVDNKTSESEMVDFSDIHNIRDYECNVSGSVDVTKSHHVIQFLAKPTIEHSDSSHPAIEVYGFGECWYT